MKSQATFVALLLFSISACVQSNDVKASFPQRTDGSQINYYVLETSVDSSSDTLLLILQGSDCNSVLYIESIFSDHKDFWPEADILLIENMVAKRA